MSSLLFRLVFALPLFLCQNSLAGLSIGAAGNLSSISSQQLTTAPTGSEAVYDGNIAVQIRKDSSFYLVVGYLFASSVIPINATNAASLTSNNPYFGAKYVMFKEFMAVGVYSAPQVQAIYTVSGQSETWSGTGVYSKLSFYPKLADWISLELAIVYYSASFNSKSATTNISSVTSFSQSIVAPMIGFKIMF